MVCPLPLPFNITLEVLACETGQKNKQNLQRTQSENKDAKLLLLAVDVIVYIQKKWCLQKLRLELINEFHVAAGYKVKVGTF